MQNYYNASSYTPMYGYSGMSLPLRLTARQTQQQIPMQLDQQIPMQFQQQSPRVIREFAPFTYPQNFRSALELISEAVEGEAQDRKFYEYLIENAPNDEAREIVRQIRDDEISHFNLFRQIYYALTDQTLPEAEQGDFPEPDSYCEGIERAIRGEQDAVRRYRRILYALTDRVLINAITDIITDEIRHGLLYNYLYSKGKCSV